jgi:hypothetical protein
MGPVITVPAGSGRVAIKIEARPDSAAAPPTGRGLEGRFEGPHVRHTKLQARPGSAGASPSVGGLGGLFEATH